MKLQRTMADQVAGELHGAILRGEYAGGSALPIRDLAERFSTSPMPIRDALRQLEALGLVEILPHRGARVLELSFADLHATYEARAALESAAIELAAERITEDELAQANSFLQQHNAAVEAGQVDDARVAHRQFHFSLYTGAGSEWLVRGIEPAWQNAERYLFAAPDIDVNHDQSAVEHAEILAACSEHDSKRAAHAIRKHILGARDRIATQLQESQIFVKAR